MTEYKVRYVTEPAWGGDRAGVRVVAYEVVDVWKAKMHASDQVIYTTTDYDEAERYAYLLNSQAKVENLTNVRTTEGE
jgi:hypothetical protein